MIEPFTYQIKVVIYVSMKQVFDSNIVVTVQI